MQVHVDLCQISFGAYVQLWICKEISSIAAISVTDTDTDTDTDTNGSTTNISTDIAGALCSCNRLIIRFSVRRVGRTDGDVLPDASRSPLTFLLFMMGVFELHFSCGFIVYIGDRV